MRIEIYSIAAVVYIKNRANTFESIYATFLRRHSKEWKFTAKLLYTNRQIVEVSSTKGLVNVHRKGSMPLILSPCPGWLSVLFHPLSSLPYIWERQEISWKLQPCPYFQVAVFEKWTWIICCQRPRQYRFLGASRELLVMKMCFLTIFWRCTLPV